jgi:hypothetical protein
LITSVLPATMAGPSFADMVNTGPFHGMIAPTTPSGSHVV